MSNNGSHTNAFSIEQSPQHNSTHRPAIENNERRSSIRTMLFLLRCCVVSPLGVYLQLCDTADTQKHKHNDTNRKHRNTNDRHMIDCMTMFD